MSDNGADGRPVVSIIAAVLNEGPNIRPLCQEIATVLGQLPRAEVIFVDDGSSDDTVTELEAVRRDGILPDLRILAHDTVYGKSAGLRTGVEAARGEWVILLDGDGQDNPADFVPMLEACRTAKGRAPLVVGVRTRRRDTMSRRLASRFANALRGRMLNDGCPDTGASLKAFRREDFLCLPQFEGLHRFLPSLMGRRGVPLACISVHHRNRLHGSSKYTNLNRAIVGIRDILGVMWLNNRARIPKRVTER